VLAEVEGEQRRAAGGGEVVAGGGERGGGRGEEQRWVAAGSGARGRRVWLGLGRVVRLDQP
jgi:hypothetical protein